MRTGMVVCMRVCTAVHMFALCEHWCSNLGNAYKELGRLDDAIKCYTAAISIKPSFADAYSNLGSAYKVCSFIAFTPMLVCVCVCVCVWIVVHAGTSVYVTLLTLCV
jgi:hypothetical protein